MIQTTPVLLCLAMLPLVAVAETANHERHAAQSWTTFSGYKTKITVPRVTLHDSEGREQELPRLMHNRVVILNFVFTSCSTICPMLSAIMHATEQRLAKRLGKGVILISISVDPVNDTPERLHAYAKKIGSGSNWYWLTGRPVDISHALRAFGVPTGGRPKNHPPTILVGNTTTGQWLRWVGMATPENLINAVDTVTDNTSHNNKRSHAQQR